MEEKAPIIVLAGATGDLGGRIAREITQLGGQVRALVRPGTAEDRLWSLRELGAEIREVKLTDAAGLADACGGAACVVSALSGLAATVIDGQTQLLEAAEAAGVPRFMPSDFSLDFTGLPRGTNRNLDMRNVFRARADASSLRITSVLNGMFADLLNGLAPFVIDRIHRVLYYGDASQPMDFTTMDDTARFTAHAALDPDTPRYLRIAGDVLDAHGLAEAATRARGEPYRTLRIGGVRLLSTLIDVTRLVAPQRDEVYPPWQGMQYMRNMFSGRGKLNPLDNDRYADMEWTSVESVLRAGAQQPAKVDGKS
ncbi:NmrA family NAD(P)-binding protein [Lewinella sp. IMCC34183]|uniref:NmrA family NAD(P)-binding protein n=1 Tax=Lewinella sp. IMCC34183 TaxID=2248762 RepID=UPI000E23584F|nr:NmrA family NAD(P)-binding protein [Lewinella sp. IMCC34183]